MIVCYSQTGLIPGGFRFADQRVAGKRFGDDGALFLDDCVQQIISFRRQNPNVYDPHKDSVFMYAPYVKQEVITQNFERLNGDPRYFGVVNGMVDQKLPSKHCDCNVPLVPRLCPTCAAYKIIGYRCPTCGREYDK